MSRLDSFIRRMQAQRDILDDLASRDDMPPGPILEFGLGSGRTLDHLRTRFPDRRVIVFERVLGSSPITCPNEADLVVGDIRETAARFPDGFASLVHADIETGMAEIDVELAAWLPALVARLLAPSGYAVSGCALADPRLSAERLPASVAPGRYHLARRSP